MVEKFYISPSQQKIILRINRDPDIRRQIRNDLMRSQSQQNQAGN